MRGRGDVVLRIPRSSDTGATTLGRGLHGGGDPGDVHLPGDGADGHLRAGGNGDHIVGGAPAHQLPLSGTDSVLDVIARNWGKEGIWGTWKATNATPQPAGA